MKKLCIIVLLCLSPFAFAQPESWIECPQLLSWRMVSQVLERLDKDTMNSFSCAIETDTENSDEKFLLFMDFDEPVGFEAGLAAVRAIYDGDLEILEVSSEESGAWSIQAKVNEWKGRVGARFFYQDTDWGLIIIEFRSE